MESITTFRSVEDDFTESGKELFGHHNVIYGNSNMSTDESPCIGSLSVVQYSFGICIEWKPSEVSVVSECQDHEWALVNTVGHRSRTLSGSTEAWRSQVLKIPLNDIEGYRVFHKKKKLTLVSKNSSVSHTFYFQFGNSDGLTQILKSFITPKRSKDDKKYYVIVFNKTPDLPKSFSDLSLVPEVKEGVWNFVSNLKHHPYETTMNTFSKFSEYILYRQPENRPSEDEEVEMGSSVGSQNDDFTLVNRETPRPLPPRGPPLSMAQFVAATCPTGKVNDPAAVKEIIFRGGCDPSLRCEVWKFLLNYYPWDSSTEERLELRNKKTQDYNRMKKQWKSLSPEQESRFSAFRERKSIIEKDALRTDRTLPFYAGDNNPNVDLLMNILTTYAMYNFDLGYVQGMSDLLSPILALLSDEVDAFWCFVGFMDKVYHNFDEDQGGMKKQLGQLQAILSDAEPSLAAYLTRHDSGNMFFCFRWLLVWFKREFSYDDIMYLWEVLWTDLPCSNFHLLICVAILESEKKVLPDKNYGFPEILKHFNELSNQLDVKKVVGKAEAIYEQLISSDKLSETTKKVIGLVSGGSDTPGSTSSEEEETPVPPHNGDLEANFERDLMNHYL